MLLRSMPGLPCALGAGDCDISDSRLKTFCDRDAVSLGVRAAGNPAGSDGVRPAMFGRLAGVCGTLTLGADGAGRVTLGVLARSGRVVALGADGVDRVMPGADGDGLAKLGVLARSGRAGALGADRDRIGLDDEFAGPRIAGDEKGETAGVLRAGVREVGAPWNERTLPLDRDRLGIAGDEDRLELLGERLMLGAGERDAGIDLADGVGADRDIDAEGLDGARAAGWDRSAPPVDLDDWPRPRDGPSAAGDTQVIVKTVSRATHPPRDAQRF